jgi:hypothetical protein
MPQLPHAHHETSRHDSPNKTKVKEKTKQNYPGFEFKPHQVNDSSQSNQGTDHLSISDSNSNLTKSMTHHNQTKELIAWFLNLPVDESIDNKSTKFKVRIQDPMKHS